MDGNSRSCGWHTSRPRLVGVGVGGSWVGGWEGGWVGERAQNLIDRAAADGEHGPRNLSARRAAKYTRASETSSYRSAVGRRAKGKPKQKRNSLTKNKEENRRPGEQPKRKRVAIR